MNQEATPWHITGVGKVLKRTVMAAVLAVALDGCTRAPCPNDLPTACPTPAPTFSQDVAPLIQNHCAGCHSADGEEPTPSLINYSGVTGSMDSVARMVETQLVQCKMPPDSEPELTPEERRTILGWIICGAQNN